jgi:hypothetical protein
MMSESDEAEVDALAETTRISLSQAVSNTERQDQVAATIFLHPSDTYTGFSGKKTPGVESRLYTPSANSGDAATAPKSNSGCTFIADESSSLCHYCRKFVSEWPDPDALDSWCKRSEHHSTEKELLDSASAGCSMCAQILLAEGDIILLEDEDDRAGIYGLYLGTSRFPAPYNYAGVRGGISLMDSTLRPNTKFLIRISTPKFSATKLDMRDQIPLEITLRFIEFLQHNKS